MILLTGRDGKKFLLDSNSIRYTLPSKFKIDASISETESAYTEIDTTLVATTLQIGESSTQALFECLETAEEILALHKTSA